MYTGFWPNNWAPQLSQIDTQKSTYQHTNRLVESKNIRTQKDPIICWKQSFKLFSLEAQLS